MSPIKKPAKPHPDFPLYAHAGKVWAKKILGKLWYFGPWDDPQAALEKYLAQKDSILAGRDPRKLAGVVGVDSGDGCKVRLLVNSFLNAKRVRMDSGQLSRKMFTQYHDACSIIVDQFGKESQVAALKPADFSACLAALPKTWGLEMIGGTVGRIRSVFKFASDEQLVDRPVMFGNNFQRPSKLQKRRDKQQKLSDRGRLDFTAAEAKLLIESTNNIQLKACILLGLNAGFGNTDCAGLTTRVIDLESGWIDYPRPKTGIPRRVPMWPETVQAIKTALAKRPIPKDAAHDSLVFVTSQGMPLVWDRITKGENGKPDKYLNVNNLTLTFGRLLTKLDLRKSGHNFYSLRRCFETVAGESKDQVAVNFIMGHEDATMAATYRQGLEDSRLRAVTDHVRAWVFPELTLQESQESHE